MPVALATNGTVREARGFASITNTSPSRTANCTLTSPTTPSARASSRVWRRTSASTVVADRERRDHAGRVAGVDAGLLDVLHDRADQHVVAVGDRVDVDLDRVLDERVDQRARGDRPRAQHLLVVADAHRAATEHVARPHQHRIADLRGRRAPPRRRRSRSPRPAPSGRSSRAASRTAARSSARSMAWNGVPRIGTPASISRFASRSGVWPPNWITTPAGCSTSTISSTSSIVSGSKYSRSDVS